MPDEGHPGSTPEPLPPTGEQGAPNTLEGILAARGIGVTKFTHPGTGNAAGYTQSYSQLTGEGAGQLSDVDAAHMEANHMDATHDILDARGRRDGVIYDTEDGRFVPGRDVLSPNTDAPALAHSKSHVRISPRSTRTYGPGPDTDEQPRRLEKISDDISNSAAVRGLKKYLPKRKGGH